MSEDDASIAVGMVPVSTPTRHKAMEWSLVLLSQGIESMTACQRDTDQWQLIVPANQIQSVRETLQLYERENQFWPFRQHIPWAGLSFDWSVLAWVVLMIVLFFLQGLPGSALEPAGICNVGLVKSGEWWRLWTATTLHSDLGHLTMNAVFGLLLLGVAMGRFGSGLALFAATLSGALANLVPLLWREDRVSALGASGVVMAALGMIAAGAAVDYWKRKHPPRFILEILVGGLLLFVLVGASPTSDVAAHAGGFLLGILLGFPLAAVPLTVIRKGRLNWAVGLTYCLIMISAWMFALRKGPF